jgi:hypothetical protein
MNCLLLRELPLRAILRLWDTYLSEDIGGFENFHVYVCAVLLKTYKEKLMTMVCLDEKNLLYYFIGNNFFFEFQNFIVEFIYIMLFIFIEIYEISMFLQIYKRNRNSFLL